MQAKNLVLIKLKTAWQNWAIIQNRIDSPKSKLQEHFEQIELILQSQTTRTFQMWTKNLEKKLLDFIQAEKFRMD